MVRQVVITTATGLALAWSVIAVARETDQSSSGLQDQQTGQQQHQPQPGQQDKPSAEGQAGAQQGRLKLKKADQVIGTEVVNSQGEKLGHIRELAIDGNTGQVAYAVLEFDEILNIRDKLFAVPFSALKIKGEATGRAAETDQAARDRLRAGKQDESWFTTEEGQVGVKQFVLDVPKEKLEQAPGFDRDRWPEMADPQWGKEVHSFYNQKPYWESQERQGMGQGQTGRDRGVDVRTDAGTSNQGVRVQTEVDRGRAPDGQAGANRHGQQAQGKRMILKAKEQLIGHEISNNQGENIGELHNLLVDRPSGKVAFVIVELDEVEGDKNLAALPWNQINWKWDEQKKEGSITLKSDVNQLQRHLFAENQWPDLSNQQYASALYRQFDARPFWETQQGTEDVLGFQE